MKRILIIIVFLLYLCNQRVCSQTIWTIGPMIHVNIGEQKARMSYNIEFAYWNFNKFPYSIDFAVEFEKQKIRLYSELQTGIGLAGTSAGPVFEIQTNEGKCKLGFQCSVWGNYFLGFDLRYRVINGNSFFSPGIYVKGGFNGRDENGEKIEGSGWHDLDDD